MELSDIFRQIDETIKGKQRRISKNYLTVRVSDEDLELIAVIKSNRKIKTSAAIKEAIAFYCSTLQNKNNN
jgi:hypothetical protein